MTNQNGSSIHSYNSRNNIKGPSKQSKQQAKLKATPQHKVTNSFLSDVSSFRDVNHQDAKTYCFLVSRVYSLSSFIGDRQSHHNTIKGLIGRILWITNIIIHFSFDFYEAATVFHYSWASSVGVFLVMFVICTVFLIRHTVKWFTKTLKKLCKDEMYSDTVQYIILFFKVNLSIFIVENM